MVTLAVDPAREPHPLADVGGAQRATGVSPVGMHRGHLLEPPGTVGAAFNDGPKRILGRDLSRAGRTVAGQLTRLRNPAETLPLSILLLVRISYFYLLTFILPHHILLKFPDLEHSLKKASKSHSFNIDILIA